MRYYLIAGEASGDLHASRLMRALRRCDAEAEFRFFGGDLMAGEGGTLVKHYRELAYMGFVPVLMHLPTILRNMKRCKEDIAAWQPDVVVLVDYPGFNLDIAKFVHASGICPVYYYISPKIWAWKEYRIRRIKRDIDELFSILPFEVDFFEKKHHFPIHYVGNPTASEVREYLSRYEVRGTRCENSSSADSSLLPRTSHLAPRDKPFIALLAGSRRQEIKDNLPAMIEATSHLADRYQVVLAGAPSIEPSYYEPFIKGTHVQLVMNETYQLLSEATAALVTSGTATLETCMFRVPQVVCYYTPLKHFIGMMRRMVLKVRYVSLVNLIADREVVTELVAETFSIGNIRRELEAVLPGGYRRQQMLTDYEEIHHRLGESDAPERAAELMIKLLS
ncbi:MAG: lipid-A-disaccharide synthase [Prevotella sp.]|nr:lipid-A-disaccharide synthase [Prevotella sp.]